MTSVIRKNPIVEFSSSLCAAALRRIHPVVRTILVVTGTSFPHKPGGAMSIANMLTRHMILLNIA